MAKPRLLVIGAGFAGATLATAAQAFADVTLVDKNDYMEIAFANARTLVEPSATSKTLLHIEGMKPHGRFIQGQVASLTDTAATLQDGTVLSFDYAAICTGSSYDVGKGEASSLEARQAEVQALADRVKAARSVLVIGGGPLGVELAGEICTDYPDKVLTLVHNGPRLLPVLAPRLGTAAAKWFTAQGTKVLLNDRVDPTKISGGKAVTKNGVEVAAEVVLLATGIRLNSAFMEPALADALDGTGAIKVDKHFQVVGHPTLFALGDVTNIKEDKLAFLAVKHAQLVAKNLAAVVKGGAKAKLGAWKPGMGMKAMFVSTGRRHGFGQVACLSFVGFPVTQIKSQGVIKNFVTQYRGNLLVNP